jgi:copper chaperone NosL
VSLLDNPLHRSARFALALLVIPLCLMFTAPLWRISLEAPQYPRGLRLDIYAHKIEGGNNGQHLTEINNLNHYIGMHKIDRGELSDLDWIPFAVGALVLITLRCAVVGNVRALIDLLVIAGYVGVFSMGRFVYKLYVFGHTLDPNAPVKVPPFTPAIIGTKQLANFTTHSFPQLGTLYMTVFMLGLAVLTAWHLYPKAPWRRRGSSPAPAMPAAG